MSGTTEAFARVRIDALLQDAGWNLTDGSSVLFEHALPDGTQADYVLCDRQGRPMAALEAKRASIDPIAAQDQGRHYAVQLNVPFVFLSNGEEVRFLDRETDAHAREIAGFYAQDDLERRIAARRVRLDPSTVAIDRKIVDRNYQIECIEALSAEVSRGRRKLLVEMATGTGKTRTAAAFIKRLFEAGIVTRVLFLVDRIALARQAEDAFTDHLRDYPCHVLRPGRGFDRVKRVTIATLQTMIAEYRTLSPGYFDLVITDECHRSIYGKWSGVLRHFDGIQLGLTATPCTAEADALSDPEDGLFVRDTLRYISIRRPSRPLCEAPAISEQGRHSRVCRQVLDGVGSASSEKWSRPRIRCISTAAKRDRRIRHGIGNGCTDAADRHEGADVATCAAAAARRAAADRRHPEPGGEDRTAAGAGAGADGGIHTRSVRQDVRRPGRESDGVGDSAFWRTRRRIPVWDIQEMQRRGLRWTTSDTENSECIAQCH